MFIQIFKDSKIDFAKKSKVASIVSIVAVLSSIGILLTKGINYGIDFTGGAEVQVKFGEPKDLSEVRESLDKAGINSAKVVTLGDLSQGVFLIKVPSTQKDLNQVTQVVTDGLKSKFGESFEVQRNDVVGPAAGKTLREQGFLALLYSLLGILLYVGIRFDSRYAPGTVIALGHDAIIVLGVFALLGKTFDLSVLAAILALMGYSNNDTIIVYDRVREVLGLKPNIKIEDGVNEAINSTLGRTLITGLTTFFVVFVLWIAGGPVIENFAFAFLIGIIVGTYSSIFVGASLLMAITKWQDKRGSYKPNKPRVTVRDEPA